MKTQTIKKLCRGGCGRKIIVRRPKHGQAPKPLCRHCKQYGVEESRRQNINRKSEYTEYE